MGRVVQVQNNIWGASTGDEPQRSDLWFIDFSRAVAGLNSQLFEGDYRGLNQAGDEMTAVPDILPHQAMSVSLPEMRVKSEQTRRDSNPYNMPGFDDPPDAVRVQFILESARGGQPSSPFESTVHKFLSRWRTFVRAGRQGMSTEAAISLNSRYRIDYAFDVYLTLLRGSEAVVTSKIESMLEFVRQVNANVASGYLPGTDGINVARRSASREDNGNVIQNDLQVSTRLILKKAWLGNFKISDLNYEAAKVTTIDAQFYVEDVLPIK